jgi:excinuclease ABC subunit C
MVIDGGRGQVKMVLQALRATPLAGTMVIGLEKRPDRLVLPVPVEMGARAGGAMTGKIGADSKRPAGSYRWEILKLPANSPVLHLLEQIRDEAHRFGKARHVRRREKDLFD